MAKVKQVKPKNITHECYKCSNSIERDNKTHCKNRILDLTKPFSSYSEVTKKIDCNYYRELL